MHFDSIVTSYIKETAVAISIEKGENWKRLMHNRVPWQVVLRHIKVKLFDRIHQFSFTNDVGDDERANQYSQRQ